MPTIENTTVSSQVRRRLLGLSLHDWENMMALSLAVAAFAAAIVGVSTWAVIQLQREEAKESSEKIAGLNTRAKEAELRLTELRDKVARPRQLNEAVFLEEIKGIPPMPIEITLWVSDPDSHWLAFSLWGSLEKAGWPVIQSGTTYQMFSQTPEPIKSCAGNFGGIRVLSKRLSEQDVANMQAPPPRPNGTSPLIGLSDVLWKAVGENEVGFATCPFLPEGRLHVVIAPKWVILPAIPAASKDDAHTK